MTKDPTEEIVLFRCLSCHRLLHTRIIQKYGKCKCGGRRICGASPVTLIEKIQVFYWELTVR
jgi:DNA-directed RNA polymerase subunit RPC12/RpoP